MQGPHFVIFPHVERAKEFMFQLVVLRLQDWALSIIFPLVSKGVCVQQNHIFVLFQWSLWISPGDLSSKLLASGWKVKIWKRNGIRKWAGYLSDDTWEVSEWLSIPVLPLLTEDQPQRFGSTSGWGYCHPWCQPSQVAMPPTASPGRWDMVGFISRHTSGAWILCYSVLDSVICHAYRCSNEKHQKSLRMWSFYLLSSQQVSFRNSALLCRDLNSRIGLLKALQGFGKHRSQGVLAAFK